MVAVAKSGLASASAPGLSDRASIDRLFAASVNHLGRGDNDITNSTGYDMATNSSKLFKKQH